MSLKALGFQVLIKPRPVEEVTPGGIVLPEEVKKAEKLHGNVGWIVDIGPLAFKDYNKDYGIGLWAEVGDLIKYSRYGGSWVEDPDTEEEYVIVSDGDLLCKIDEENDNNE